MKKLLFAIVLFFSTFGFSQVDTKYVNDALLPSVVAIFRLDGANFVSHCTAFAIRRTDDEYWFGSAAHCNKENVKLFAQIRKKPNITEMVPVEWSFTGKPNGGTDGAVFVIHSKENIPLLSLGNDPTQIGTSVYNAGFPLNDGLLFLTGHISNLHFEDWGTQLNWNGYLIVQTYGTNPGLSGSPLVCADQLAVCGILVGVADSYTVALPISRFKVILEQAEKTYKSDSKK